MHALWWAVKKILKNQKNLAL